MRRVLALMVGLLVGTPVVAQEVTPAQGEIEASKLSQVPRQKKFLEAEYPKQAFDQGLEAEVILLLDIDEKGLVTGVGVATPAEPPGLGFDEAAMIAANAWEFEPAMLDGQPIAVQLTYRYRFTLETAPRVPPPPPVAPSSEPTAPTAQPSAPARVPVANFTGQLTERGTRLPMAGVIVTVFRDDVVPPVGFEAATDEAGRFSFFDLQAASWKVLVDAPGYYPFRTSEAVRAGERVEATYFVEKGTYNPYDVTVTATRPRKEVSRTIISAEELDKVPGGAGDPLSVVQNFAGVARTEGADQLVIRGSAPEDSRVFIDGVGVPLLYHFGGLKSVLPVGMLESIEFYPGNFAPMYGRATGGIVDVRIKDLEPENVGGYADVSILDTGVYLEVPLGQKGAVAIAGRRSYIDVILNAVVSDDAPLTLQTAPVYYDYQLLANYRPAPEHTLRLFAFGSDDRLAIVFKNPADLDTELEGDTFSNVTSFYRAIAEYRYVPSKDLEHSTKLSAGYDSVAFGAGQLKFNLTLTTFQVRDVTRVGLNEFFALSAGVDAIVTLATTDIRLPRPPKEGQPETGIDIREILVSRSESAPYFSPAAFIEGEVTPIPGLMFLPGLRVDRFDLSDDWAIQPRLTARWQVGEPVVVKAGVGLFVQEPTFEEADEAFGNPDLTNEEALHYSVGAEYAPSTWLTLDATAFYKDLSSLVSPTDEVVERDGETRPLVYDNKGEGRVYGLELQARHAPSHGLSGWLAYTLSRAERVDSGSEETRLFDYDQTHILTAVANYMLPRNWQVGARFRLVSGNPSTPVVGATYNSSRDEYEPRFGGTNTGRDPLFHQLDLRVDKRWVYQSWMLNAYLDIQNVYNHENATGVEYNYDFTEQTPETGVPLFPIIGLRAEF